MKKWRLTKVFRIDDHLVVADSIEKAIKLYKSYMDDEYITIKHIETVFGDYSGIQDGAIIERKEDEY